MAWGYCLSPLVLEDSILFRWDHQTGPCFLIGLDKRTGEIAWQKGRPIGTAHATPVMVTPTSATMMDGPSWSYLLASDFF